MRRVRLWWEQTSGERPDEGNYTPARQCDLMFLREIVCTRSLLPAPYYLLPATVAGRSMYPDGMGASMDRGALYRFHVIQYGSIPCRRRFGAHVRN